MTDAEHLRELLDLKELHLKELFDARLRSSESLLQQRIQLNEQALRLQAAEYDRRLDGLNHEAAQLKSMQERYVSRETYGIEVGKNTNDLADIKTALANLLGKVTVTSAVTAFVVSAALAGGLVLVQHYIH